MYIIHCKMKGVLPVVMTRNTFFRSISYPISGRKAPQPVLRTVLVYQRCDVAKGVRKNVSQHPCGARYGSRVRAERSVGDAAKE